jgi:hypothetical protein
MNHCKNCNEPINRNYCPNCGQPAKLKRIDRQYIIREIASAFNAERGMLYTLKRMLISPGESIRQYITEDRSRYVKPVSFVIITSLIYVLVNHFFQIGIKDYASEADLIEGTTAGLIVSWTMENSGYSNILEGLIMAFWIQIFFRKTGYNLFEIFILLCFVTGIVTLFLSIVTIIQGIMHLKLLQFSSFIVMAYLTWAVGQFFDRTKALSYIKAFLSYFLGSIVFTGLLVLAGILFDNIIN